MARVLCLHFTAQPSTAFFIHPPTPPSPSSSSITCSYHSSLTPSPHFDTLATCHSSTQPSLVAVPMSSPSTTSPRSERLVTVSTRPKVAGLAALILTTAIVLCLLWMLSSLSSSSFPAISTSPLLSRSLLWSLLRALLLLWSLYVVALSVLGCALVLLGVLPAPCSVCAWHGGQLSVAALTSSDRLLRSHRHSVVCALSLFLRFARLGLLGRRLPWSASSLCLVDGVSGQSVPGRGWRVCDPQGELGHAAFLGLPASAASTSVGRQLYHVYAGPTPVALLATYEAVADYYSEMRQVRGADGERMESSTGGRDRNARFSFLGFVVQSVMGESVGVKVGREWNALRSCLAPHFTRDAVSTSYRLVQDAVAQWMESAMLSQPAHSPGGYHLLDVYRSRLYVMPMHVIASIVYGPLPTSALATLESLCHDHLLLMDQSRRLHSRLPRLVLQLVDPVLCRRLRDFKRAWVEFNESQRQRILAAESTSACLYGRLARQPNKAISDDEFLDTMDEILLLNHDVTYITIMAACTLLAAHPHVQSRVRDEIRQVQTLYGEQCDVESVHHMSLLHAVMLESMRLWPPIHLTFPEHTTAACVVDRYVLPAHTVVCVDVESVNRDVERWTDPDQFDPDRFLRRPADATRFHRFGLSSRQCLGQQWAQHIIKTLLVHMIKHYELSVQPDDDPSKPAWSMEQRTLKTDGLPLLTAYSCFPVLRCVMLSPLAPITPSVEQSAGAAAAQDMEEKEDSGEQDKPASSPRSAHSAQLSSLSSPVAAAVSIRLSVTSHRLPASIFQAGLHRLASGDGVGIVGMSLGNSFFSGPIISAYIHWMVRRFARVYVFIPDYPAQFSYAAMGYTGKDIKKKTTWSANRYRRFIHSAVRSLPPSEQERVRVVQWESEVESSRVYQSTLQLLLAAYQRGRESGSQFAVDVSRTTEDAISKQVKPHIDLSTAVTGAARYLLMELALLSAFHRIYPSAPSTLVYVYHRRWPVFERLMSGHYHDTTHVTQQHAQTEMAFVLLEPQRNGME